jgi:hypothetical protein
MTNDLSSDIKSLVEKIDSMPAATRDGILNGLLSAKAERMQQVVKKTYTAMQCVAADSRNAVLLKQVSAMCSRHGFEIPAHEKISLTKLDQALKASGADTDTRFRIKDCLAQLNLI